MASPNRNQHWVPQFYLRYFATPETRHTNHPQLWSFPIKQGKEFCTSVRNVAAKRDLYACCPPQVDKKLTDFESLLGNYWPKIAEERYPLDLGFKRGISLFIATLYMRHPLELERHRRFTASMAKAIESGPHDEGGRSLMSGLTLGEKDYEVDASEIDKWRTQSDEDIQAAWGNLILSMSGEIAQSLMARPWTVLVRDKPAFITTDHPVALHNSKMNDAPLLNQRTKIYFPLTPQKLVVINGEKEHDGKLVMIHDGGEAAFNYIIFQSGYQHVFSAWEPIEMLDQIIRFDKYVRAECNQLRQNVFGRLKKSIGRNDPCYCGSGLKFKRCCGL